MKTNARRLKVDPARHGRIWGLRPPALALRSGTMCWLSSKLTSARRGISSWRQVRVPAHGTGDLAASGGPNTETRKILAEFDANHDGWLNLRNASRRASHSFVKVIKAAAEARLAADPSAGPRGPGGRGGRGFGPPGGRSEPGTPGPHPMSPTFRRARAWISTI
jgi:hypothetical protein